MDFSNGVCAKRFQINSNERVDWIFCRSKVYFIPFSEESPIKSISASTMQVASGKCLENPYLFNLPYNRNAMTPSGRTPFDRTSFRPKSLDLRPNGCLTKTIFELTS
jgi:hypothetical protein